MADIKRIPVSEETWKKLGKEKDPGQTLDEFLEEINIQAKKNKLAERTKKGKKGELETVSLDKV